MPRCIMMSEMFLKGVLSAHAWAATIMREIMLNTSSTTKICHHLWIIDVWLDLSCGLV
jgi:hypothetical protein